MTESPPADWYLNPASSGGLRWWDGSGWSDRVVHETGLGRLARPLLLAASIFVLLGTLFAGPQAFGAAMMNFDEQLINTRAVLTGLFGFAALSILMFLFAGMRYRSRTAQGRRIAAVLAMAVIALEIASVAGLTEAFGAFVLG